MNSQRSSRNHILPVALTFTVALAACQALPPTEFKMVQYGDKPDCTLLYDGDHPVVRVTRTGSNVFTIGKCGKELPEFGSAKVVRQEKVVIIPGAATFSATSKTGEVRKLSVRRKPYSQSYFIVR